MWEIPWDLVATVSPVLVVCLFFVLIMVIVAGKEKWMFGVLLVAVLAGALVALLG